MSETPGLIERLEDVETLADLRNCNRAMTAATLTEAAQAIRELVEGLTEATDQLWHMAKEPGSNPLVLECRALITKYQPTIGRATDV